MEDYDQPATLEWVRGREGWKQYNNKWLVFCGHISFFRHEVHKLSVAGVTECYPTRKQIIAAENFAKEVGWV